MSNNNQQFSDPANFTLSKEEILTDYLYYPKIGPGEGNSTINFDYPSYGKFIYKNDFKNIINCK